MKKQIDHILENRFKIVKKIGSGAFGEIFEALDTQNNQSFAIKLEDVNTKHPQLFYEGQVYKHFHNDPKSKSIGIPTIYQFAQEGQYNALVMELLGPSLEELFILCGSKFSLKTVVMLAIQMLEIIQFIHEQQYLYRDIRPDHFLMGQGENINKLYIIDFGLAKQFVQEDGSHIIQQTVKPLKTLKKYASSNNHLRKEPSRRDDLESLGYLLIYFLKGQLPWINTFDQKIQQKETIESQMLSYSLETICCQCPKEFFQYLSYVRQLQFDQTPDYNYLQSLMQNVPNDYNFEMDFKYDWESIKHQSTQSSNLLEKNNSS